MLPSSGVVRCKSIGDGHRVVVEENSTDPVMGVDGRPGKSESPFRRTRREGCALNEQVESQTATEPIATGG